MRRNQDVPARRCHSAANVVASSEEELEVILHASRSRRGEGRAGQAAFQPGEGLSPVRRPLGALSDAGIAAVLCLGPPAGGAAQPAPLPAIEYVDVAGQVGVDFQHVTGASGRRYFPETMGSGVAFVDFDGDQNLDIYFVNGAAFPGYKGSPDPVNALFRNEGDRLRGGGPGRWRRRPGPWHGMCVCRL